MTESELLAAAHDALTRMDSVFEFWMSGTFATLVAFYFIGSAAAFRIKLLSSFLYTVFSVLMINRLVSIGITYTAFRDMLIELGSVGVISDFALFVNSIFNITIYLSGMAITIYFIFRQKNVLDNSIESDT